VIPPIAVDDDDDIAEELDRLVLVTVALGDELARDPLSDPEIDVEAKKEVPRLKLVLEVFNDKFAKGLFKDDELMLIVGPDEVDEEWLLEDRDRVPIELEKDREVVDCLPKLPEPKAPVVELEEVR